MAVHVAETHSAERGMMPGHIEDELSDAVHLNQKSKEQRQDYLKRLADAAEHLSNRAWDNLSVGAQNWSNAASLVLEKDSGKIAEFSRYEPDEKELEEYREKSRMASRKASAAGKGPLSGIKTDIKRLLLAEPRMSAEAIMEKLGKNGEVPSKFTVSSIRSDFRHSLKFLMQEGWLDRDHAKHLDL